MRRRRRALLLAAAFVAAVGAVLWFGAATARGTPPAGNFHPREIDDEWRAPSGREHAIRSAALGAAQISFARAARPGAEILLRNPPDPGGLLSRDPVTCRFLPRALSGTTPKFDCVLEGGEVVRVKYGDSHEIPAEVAATRLMEIAGFGVDRMYLVPRLRCYGCPRQPFSTMKALAMVGLRDLFLRAMGERAYTDFAWVTIERRFEGKSIEAGNLRGWGWSELRDIDPTRGATRAEVDALHLMAVFLAHWDNKPDNQRLVCLPDAAPAADGSCPRPFALIEDLGGTFGPRKADLPGWKIAPIWADARTCTATMRGLPHRTGTFMDVQISESGRQRVLDTIGRLTDAELTALFEVARFPAYGRLGVRGASATEWAAVFRDRVRQIAEAGPCPP